MLETSGLTELVGCPTGAADLDVRCVLSGTAWEVVLHFSPNGFNYDVSSSRSTLPEEHLALVGTPRVVEAGLRGEMMDPSALLIGADQDDFRPLPPFDVLVGASPPSAVTGYRLLVQHAVFDGPFGHFYFNDAFVGSDLVCRAIGQVRGAEVVVRQSFSSLVATTNPAVPLAESLGGVVVAGRDQVAMLLAAAAYESPALRAATTRRYELNLRLSQLAAHCRCASWQSALERTSTLLNPDG